MRGPQLICPMGWRRLLSGAVPTFLALHLIHDRVVTPLKWAGFDLSFDLHCMILSMVGMQFRLQPTSSVSRSRSYRLDLH